MIGNIISNNSYKYIVINSKGLKNKAPVGDVSHLQTLFCAT